MASTLLVKDPLLSIHSIIPEVVREVAITTFLIDGDSLKTNPSIATIYRTAGLGYL